MRPLTGNVMPANSRLKRRRWLAWAIVGPLLLAGLVWAFVTLFEASVARTFQRYSAQVRSQLATAVGGQDSHITGRVAAIVSRLAQAKGPMIVLLGDSIVENSAIEQYDARIFNAGIAGTTIVNAQHVLDAILRSDAAWSKVSCIMLYTGINDAFGLADAPHSLASVEAYRTAAQLLADSAGSAPVVLFKVVGPTTGQMPIDGGTLEGQNASLDTIVGERVHVFDLGQPMMEAARASGNIERVFIDGVHITPLGYPIWHDLISRGAEFCGPLRPPDA